MQRNMGLKNWPSRSDSRYTRVLVFDGHCPKSCYLMNIILTQLILNGSRKRRRTLAPNNWLLHTLTVAVAETCTWCRRNQGSFCFSHNLWLFWVLSCCINFSRVPAGLQTLPDLAEWLQILVSALVRSMLYGQLQLQVMCPFPRE